MEHDLHSFSMQLGELTACTTLLVLERIKFFGYGGTAMDIESLSTSDLVALAFQVLQELANRLGRAGSSERVPEPAASEGEPALLVPNHCGYRCTFCERPCSRSDEGHRHHKCRQHRRW